MDKTKSKRGGARTNSGGARIGAGRPTTTGARAKRAASKGKPRGPKPAMPGFVKRPVVLPADFVAALDIWSAAVPGATFSDAVRHCVSHFLASKSG